MSWMRRVRRALLALSLLTVAFPSRAHTARPHVHRGKVVPVRIQIGKPKPLANPVVLGGQAMGALDLHLETEETRVIVDGERRVRLGEFDGLRGNLYLIPGLHEITLENPEGESWSEQVRVTAGTAVELRVELVN